MIHDYTSDLNQSEINGNKTKVIEGVRIIMIIKYNDDINDKKKIVIVRLVIVIMIIPLILTSLEKKKNKNKGKCNTNNHTTIIAKQEESANHNFYSSVKNR